MREQLPLNVLIAGVGGQGNLIASRLLGAVAMRNGYQVTIGETKGASQRSGPVTSHIRLSRALLGPLIPGKMAHVILGFEPLETLRASRKYSGKDTIALLNPAPIMPMLVAQGLQQYPPIAGILRELGSLNRKVYVIEAAEAARKIGDPILLNVIMVGALCGFRLLPFERQHFVDAIHDGISEKYRDLNLRAFEAGYEEGFKQSPEYREERAHA